MNTQHTALGTFSEYTELIYEYTELSYEYSEQTPEIWVATVICFNFATLITIGSQAFFTMDVFTALCKKKTHDSTTGILP